MIILNKTRIKSLNAFKFCIVFLLFFSNNKAYSQDFVMKNNTGDGFCYKGKEFRFIGVNATKLHWDPGTTGPNGWTINDVKHVIRKANDMGVKVIRIFLARNIPAYNDTKAAINDLKRLMDWMNDINPEMKLLVAFTDSFQGQQMYLPTDHKYFINNRLDHSWYVGGYKENYLPFVLDVVEYFQDEPKIFAWELGNELGDPSYPNTMFAFAKEVGGLIKVRASQMVTTGFANVQNATGSFSNFSQIYNDESPFDFVAVHGYSLEWHDTIPSNFPDQDINNANAMGMPVVVEEFGLTEPCLDSSCIACPTNSHIWRTFKLPNWIGNRASAIDRMLTVFFNHLDVEGVMQWAFVPGADIGYGDICVGLDSIHHYDFQDIYGKYEAQASILDNSSSFCSPMLSCHFNKSIYFPINQHEEHFAANNINANNLITSNAIVSYSAGNTIYLKPGFHAHLGSIFRAFNNKCPTTFNLIGVATKKNNNDASISNKKEHTTVHLGDVTVHAYPNPTTKIVTLDWERLQHFTRIVVMTPTGQTVKERMISKQSQTDLDLSNLPAGLYFVRLELAQKSPLTLRIHKY